MTRPALRLGRKPRDPPHDAGFFSASVLAVLAATSIMLMAGVLAMKAIIPDQKRIFRQAQKIDVIQALLTRTVAEINDSGSPLEAWNMAERREAQFGHLAKVKAFAVLMNPNLAERCRGEWGLPKAPPFDSLVLVGTEGGDQLYLSGSVLVLRPASGRLRPIHDGQARAVGQDCR